MPIRRFLSLAIALLLVFIFAAGVSAQDEAKEVGLVVTYPDGTVQSEVVKVPAAATTAEVLEAAAITAVIAESDFGPALCGIDGQGCDAENCFCDPEAYWAYYHLVGDAWDSSEVGIASYVPEDGAVEGFAWSGFDVDFNALVQPPMQTLADIQGSDTTATNDTSSNLFIIVLFVLITVVVVTLIIIWQQRHPAA